MKVHVRAWDLPGDPLQVDVTIEGPRDQVEPLIKELCAPYAMRCMNFLDPINLEDLLSMPDETLPRVNATDWCHKWELSPEAPAEAAVKCRSCRYFERGMCVYGRDRYA